MFPMVFGAIVGHLHNPMLCSAISRLVALHIDIDMLEFRWGNIRHRSVLWAYILGFPSALVAAWAAVSFSHGNIGWGLRGDVVEHAPERLCVHHRRFSAIVMALVATEED